MRHRSNIHLHYEEDLDELEITVNESGWLEFQSGSGDFTLYYPKELKEKLFSKIREALDAS